VSINMEQASSKIVSTLPEFTQERGLLPVTADCVVIGGGISGVMTAWYLHKAGVSVVLCEKGRIAGEQSSRNWGWVRSQGRDPKEYPMTVHALNLWHDIAKEVGASSLGFANCGSIQLAETKAEIEHFRRWINLTASMTPAGFESRILDGEAVSRVLATDRIDFAGALETPVDCRAEPGVAVPEIARILASNNVPVLTRCAVRGLDVHGGRIRGVVTEHGTINTQKVVMAGGAWSSLFCRSLGIRLPQLKVLASVCRTVPGPLVTERGVFTSGTSFRRRQDGGYTVASAGSERIPLVPDLLRYFWDFRQLISTNILAEGMVPRFDRQSWRELLTPRRWSLSEISPFEKVRTLDPKPVTKVLHKAVTNANRLTSFFGDLKIQETWAGMVDVTPDLLPVIDEVDDLPGFFLATGLSGHGFGIGPAVGHTMADLVQGKRPSVDLSPFRYSRMTDGTELKHFLLR
jgi:glycine/D-amino acid oxidase-like deaminating enzyme